MVRGEKRQLGLYLGLHPKERSSVSSACPKPKACRPRILRPPSIFRHVKLTATGLRPAACRDETRHRSGIAATDNATPSRANPAGRAEACTGSKTFVRGRDCSAR